MSVENHDVSKVYPVHVIPIPEYFQEKCARELNESPNIKSQRIQELRSMAKKNPTIWDIDFADDFLVQFLRQRKYNVERALKQLVNFCKFARLYPAVFEGFEDTVFLAESMRYCTILPRRCPDGSAIWLLELGKWDPDELPFLDFKRVGVMQVYQCLRYPMTQINGFKVIIDFTNTVFKQIKYCTPGNLYQFYHGGINCFPGRFKEIHLVDNTLVMNAAWTVIKPFLSQKMKKRVYFNSCQKDLLKYFPASILPVQYGGNLEDYHMMDWIKEHNIYQREFTLSGQANI